MRWASGIWKGEDLPGTGRGTAREAVVEGSHPSVSPRAATSPSRGGLATRQVSLRRGQPPEPVAVHDSSSLHPGEHFTGPALVDASDTTIWVPAGMTATVDRHRNLVIEASIMNYQSTRTDDPIAPELLRSRLEAIGQEAGAAVVQTAISPIVTEIEGLFGHHPRCRRLDHLAPPA